MQPPLEDDYVLYILHIYIIHVHKSQYETDCQGSPVTVQVKPQNHTKSDDSYFIFQGCL